TQFELRPHMESPDWTEINAGIQQHLQKAYNTNKGSRSLARLRDEMRQSSGTQEYPSLIDTFYVAHTVNREFLQDEDRRIYINHLARRGKQRGHIPGFGRVLPARATAGPSTPVSESADVHEDEDEDGNGDS
ncbi:hypothetical protein Tco_1510925, partial [Tanacetum coccineum]